MRAQNALIGCIVAAALMPCVSSAYEVGITAQNPRAVYLRVGEGSPSGTYNGNSLAVDPRITTVRVQVPAGVVGNGAPQTMATVGNPRITSDLDGFLFCNPGQVYIGGFYRTTSTNGSRSQPARLTMTAPESLTSAGAHTIPMSQISWTSSGNGDASQTIPGGTFQGGPQPLIQFPRNRWIESCLTFSYANQQIKAAGTYEADVTFTLAQP